ncbi:hypothetical protein PR048_025314 [Dryococelus australis]|uniref:Uncharacterized protein n=1 Tax=Dryococelus australis TaxID=614101 RepID=A0ABQ9GQY3_9NEOP|nr:hypothetical protein PR048_025314 [Dryococelus australis]
MKKITKPSLRNSARLVAVVGSGMILGRSALLRTCDHVTPPTVKNLVTCRARKGGEGKSNEKGRLWRARHLLDLKCVNTHVETRSVEGGGAVTTRSAHILEDSGSITAILIGVVVKLLASDQCEQGSIPGGVAPGLWESCRTMQLVDGFSRGSPVSPAPAFRSRSILTSLYLLQLSRTRQITALRDKIHSHGSGKSHTWMGKLPYDACISSALSQQLSGGNGGRNNPVTHLLFTIAAKLSSWFNGYRIVVIEDHGSRSRPSKCREFLMLRSRLLFVRECSLLDYRSPDRTFSRCRKQDGQGKQASKDVTTMFSHFFLRDLPAAEICQSNLEIAVKTSCLRSSFASMAGHAGGGRRRYKTASWSPPHVCLSTETRAPIAIPTSRWRRSSSSKGGGGESGGDPGISSGGTLKCVYFWWPELGDLGARKSAPSCSARWVPLNGRLDRRALVRDALAPGAISEHPGPSSNCFSVCFPSFGGSHGLHMSSHSSATLTGINEERPRKDRDRTKSSCVEGGRVVVTELTFRTTALFACPDQSANMAATRAPRARAKVIPASLQEFLLLLKDIVAGNVTVLTL